MKLKKIKNGKRKLKKEGKRKNNNNNKKEKEIYLHSIKFNKGKPLLVINIPHSVLPKGP